MKNLMVLILLLLGWFSCGWAAEKSSTLFTNATFYLTPEKTAKNLLVVAGKVAGADVDPAKYPAATVVDLNGAFAYPGFHDSHCHLLEAGMGLTGVDLEGCTNSDAIVAQVATNAAKTPKGKPIIGVGFHLSNYDAWNLKDLAKIDKAAGDHLFIAMDNLGHNCITNSIVMKKYGIKANSIVGPAGKIISQNGKPTGMLKESAMILAGGPMMKLFSNELVSAGVLKIMNLWTQFGYTQFSDMMGTPMGLLMRPEIFKDLEKQGKLPLRVDYTYTIFSLKDIPKALPYVGKDTDMVRFIGLKIFVDGAFGAGQAWTSWKNLQGNNGVYYVYYNDDKFGKDYNLTRIVEKADDLKLNVHYHVQGDQGIETILKALEALKAKRGKLSSTHTLIHLGFPRADQIARLKKFGDKVNATMQPGLWAAESDIKNYYGKRAKDAYPVMSVIRGGITTGFSTDFSVSPLDIAPPLVIMGIAANPQKYGFPANQAISPKDIVKGFTAGSSATIPKKDTGSLETGKWADMVVFSQDLFATLPADLAKVKVLSTWVGGRKVFEAKEK